MLLSEILKNTEYRCVRFVDADITQICYDSRKASPGTMFVCLVGANADGHDFIPNAYENGCRVFAVSKDVPGFVDAVFIRFSDTRKALALMSAEFFRHPADRLFTIGITGTKGKTSISFMLKSIFEHAGKKVGVVGTTGIIYDGVHEKSDNSTPESHEIHRYLADMAEKGVDVAIMEVSSQGLMMHRTYGIEFDAAIYTNLSNDHIGVGEHKDFEDYRECKSILFSQCRAAFANLDDENAAYVTRRFSGKPVFFSTERKADFYARDIKFTSDASGLKTAYTLCFGSLEYPVHMNIPGKFTVSNSLAAASCALSFGCEPEDVQKGLAGTVVEGRMQKVDTGLPFTALIDYAHNELSMENLYDTIKLYPHKRIITVFGCGGNRAKSRRYDMGRIAAERSDICVITSDNPRFEKIDDIIEDIKVGIALGKKKNPRCVTHVVKDRKEAIEFALDEARDGDVVIIPGKGHQHYEEIEGKKYPFNEKEIIEEFARSHVVI